MNTTICCAWRPLRMFPFADGTVEGVWSHGRAGTAVWFSKSSLSFGVVLQKEPGWLEEEVPEGQAGDPRVSVGVEGRASFPGEMATAGRRARARESDTARTVGEGVSRTIECSVPPRAAPAVLGCDATVNPARHQFSLGQITLQILWVLRGISFRGACAVVETLSDWGLGGELFSGAPHATTLRWWLLRLGHYQLHRPKEQADDWVWLIDHSNQIGQEKFLAVLGIRLSQMPPPGEALRLCDMQLIDLQPVTVSDKQVVYQQLEANVTKTGVPRAIVHDRGGDLAGGTALFRAAHSETTELYDVAHKAACLLKAILERDERFRQFGGQVGRTKCQVQQTELAFLVPPKPREKARYMNLQSLIRWGQETLALVDAPPKSVLQYVVPERLEEKLGWLRDFRGALSEWSELQRVIDVTVEFVRQQGVCRDTGSQLAERLNPLPLQPTAGQLRDQLLVFVRDQASRPRPGERLPGSSEILESSFGKYKALERDQVHGGLTSLLLAFGACVSEITTETVHAALTNSTTRDVIEWIHRKLGPTHASKRRLAYQNIDKNCATKLEGRPALAAT